MDKIFRCGDGCMNGWSWLDVFDFNWTRFILFYPLIINPSSAWCTDRVIFDSPITSFFKNIYIYIYYPPNNHPNMKIITQLTFPLRLQLPVPTGHPAVS